MSFTIEKIADAPAVLVQAGADFDAETELEIAVKESTWLIAEQTTPVFAIWDTCQMSTTVNIIVQGANVSRSLDIPANQVGTLVISSTPAIKMAMEGMNSHAFGHMTVPVFENLDEAVAYARQQVENLN